MAIRTSLIIDLTGNLQARARQNGQALETMGRRGQAAIRSMQTAGAAIGRSMDQAAGRYTAMIGGGAAAYSATRAVITSAQMDKQLARVARTAGATREEAQGLRDDLFRMARDTGQPVENLLTGFYGLIQAGQSWQEALGTIQAINPAMAVTGASADTLASSMTVAAQAFKFDLSDSKEAVLILDRMTKAGDLGNAELEALSGIFARVGNSAKNAGLDFSQTLGFIERLSLVEKAPERLATLADSTLRLFTNQAYMKTAGEATGVKFYDANGERRAMFDVLEEISKKYQTFKTDAERDAAFASAFGKTDLDTQRGLRILFDKGAIAETRAMAKDIENATGTVAKGLPDAVKNSVDQVARLKAALGRAADDFSRPINDAISQGIKYLLDERGLGGAEMLAGGAAASVLGFGALKLGGRALMNMGANAAGGMIGGVVKNAGLAGLKPPIPVYVVNRQMSLTRDAMMGGAPAAGTVKSPAGTTAAAGTSVAASGRSALARAGSFAGRLAGPVAAVVGLVSAADTLLDKSLTATQQAEAVAEAGGTALGGLAGAAAGAAIGSIVPVFGTAIGGVLGGILGSLGGGKLFQAAAQKINDPANQDNIARGMKDLGDMYMAGLGETVIRVDVNGGTGTVTNHTGPAQIDVYSGPGYAFGGM